ncbi:MAG: hypothetical protein EH225_10880, partial [Calditrichaeota bacterium]
MNKKKVKQQDIEQDIIRFMRDKKARSFKMKEISHGIHINKNSYHMFRNALSALEKQGKIHKLKNRRYALPTA